MQIRTKEIEKKIYQEFHLKYKAFSEFPDTGELWDLCIESVRDPALMNNIIFCNDYWPYLYCCSYIKRFRNI